ncbi:MAG: ethylbenzene dehydrogenase-related protein [Candidatus Tectimicrobiota bacterium]
MQRAWWILLYSLLGCLQVAQADVVVKFVKVADSVFTQPDPRAAVWQQATPVTIPLLPQTITTPSRFTPSVTTLEARAIHNGTWLAVLVRWVDPTRDEVTASSQFSDAVAIGFPHGDAMTVSPFMGNAGGRVEINYWKALWQRDIERGFQDVTDLHPRTVVDMYWGTTAKAPYPVPETLATPQALQWSPAIARGNPMSQLQRRTPVEQLIAEGFGTLTTQQQQDTVSAGSYRNGAWSVMFSRKLQTGDAADVVLQPATTSAINFAVWDGHSGDRSGQKNYAMWSPLVLEATQ